MQDELHKKAREEGDDLEDDSDGDGGHNLHEGIYSKLSIGDPLVQHGISLSLYHPVISMQHQIHVIDTQRHHQKNNKVSQWRCSQAHPSRQSNCGAML